MYRFVSVPAMVFQEIERCWILKMTYAPCSLKVHIEMVHEGKKPFNCEICGLSLTTKGALKIHIQMVHEKLKPFICAVCKRSFGAKQLLMWHNELHHEQVSKKKLPANKCNLCSIICLGNRALKNHIKRVHVSGLTGTYLCEPCHMSFMSEEQFTEHSRIIQSCA